MKPDSLSFLTLISSIVHFGLVDRLVSFAAVIRVVTSRNARALRDDPNNACEGDY